ncbi:DNA mismatch endonuclease Vsr [Iamia sp. SCSIO 61187]|nr:DNA mismatch endonuclease Vsr [Iamia sp. SCSIO 61187]
MPPTWRRSSLSPEARPPGRPAASSAVVRTRMQRQARRDTAAELAIRREVWRRGLRYRVDLAPLAGLRRRADLVFTKAHVAVYVDGCFWHRCPVHATSPKANSEWWREKLDANERRDRDTDQRLGDAGWTVIRIWEHEDPVAAADRIEAAVR